MDKIAIIGLGRLGLPLAATLAHREFKVMGIDVDPDVVEAVNARRVPDHIYEPGLQEMLDGTERLIATTDMESAAFMPGSVIMVNTPSEPDGAFSLEHVLGVCRELGAALRGRDTYHLVVVGSTVNPGDCDGPIREALEETSGRKVGETLGLCYCPEFVALGNTIRGFLEPDFVLVGASDIRAAHLLSEIYKKLCLNDPPIAQTNLVNAEIAKIALNCYITTKITFANQVAELCESIPGANVDAVTDVLGLDSRIGRKYLKGATAYGGNCFPRDTKSLTCAAERAGVQLPLIEAVAQTNQWQNKRLALIIQEQWERIKAEKMGILGLTFKPDTNVTTESAGMALLKLLYPTENIIAYDPLAQVEQSVESAQVCADWSDIIVVATPWPEFKEIQFHKDQVVIDCWRMLDEEGIEQVGAVYVPLGRHMER